MEVSNPYAPTRLDALRNLRREGYHVVDDEMWRRHVVTNTDEGAGLIAAERMRQVNEEGWAHAHDDEHDEGELSIAAGAYLILAYAQADPNSFETEREALMSTAPDNWPWAPDWWNPSDDPTRNLVKAGALIAAEIDRLRRARDADG